MKKYFLLMIGLSGLLAGCSTNTTTTAVSSTAESSSVKNTTTSNATQVTLASSELAKSSVSEVNQTTQPNSTVESNSETTEQQQEQTLWNAEKSAELESFMASWGQTMQQQYKSYSRSNPLNLYGLVLPETILNGEWHFLVNDVPLSLEWSDNGEGTVDFQLVAIFSDIENTHTMSSHTYFFGFENKQPSVLITQQNQGNENNDLYFKETSNQALSMGFKQIVTG